MKDLLITLGVIYLGLSIAAGIGWTGFYIWLITKGLVKSRESEKDINL